VRARGGTVSLDPNLRKEILDAPGMRDALERVLSQTDLFLPSGDELFLLTAATEEAAAVRELLGRGIRTVVVKKGARGAACYEAGGRWSAPAFAVEEVDPTGAGDTFGATFVTLWLRGVPPREALTLANAAGALAVGRRGPMEGTSSLSELERFLSRQNPRDPA
jgi:sugar/nucleoside kinase (ribokinase family)